ncbi:right-handed parallel beta-helix repeat-containing protein [candidate division KSB1 bacterium]
MKVFTKKNPIILIVILNVVFFVFGFNISTVGLDKDYNNTIGLSLSYLPQSKSSALASAGNIYYVSTDGNDSNPGTENKPWKNCPGMPGWSGNVSLNAGDIVYFKNTDIWTVSSGDAIIQVAGGVTYDGRTWGSGNRSVLRAAGEIERSVISILSDHPVEKTIVRGFEVDVNDQLTSGISINLPQATGNLTGAAKRIEDCVIHNVFSLASKRQYEYAIIIRSSNGHTLSNVEVLNCEVYNTSRIGITIYPDNKTPSNKVSNVLIRGCEVYDTGKDPNAAGSGMGAKNHVSGAIFEYNYIHDTKGNGVANNTHPDPNFKNGPQNIIIRYNIIKNCRSSGILIHNRGKKSAEIYGNLIMHNRYQGIGLGRTLTDSLSVKIYNNTLYRNVTNGSTQGSEINIGSNSADISALEIKNNIIYAASPTRPLLDSNGDITAHSNNIYFRDGGGELISSGSKKYTTENLNKWEPSAFISKPNFKNPSNLPTGFNGVYGIDIEPNSDGLSIKSGDAIDNGADLGGSYNGAINLTGKSGRLARPQGSAWDIGAYEYINAAFGGFNKVHYFFSWMHRKQKNEVRRYFEGAGRGSSYILSTTDLIMKM